MPKREIVAEHEGHEIRVVNSWFGGAKLYVDGDCRDTTNELFALGGSPILSATLSFESGTQLVEVYIRAVMTTKIKIYVDGRHIAGDIF